MKPSVLSAESVPRNERVPRMKACPETHRTLTPTLNTWRETNWGRDRFLACERCPHGKKKEILEESFSFIIAQIMSSYDRLYIYNNLYHI